MKAKTAAVRQVVLMFDLAAWNRLATAVAQLTFAEARPHLLRLRPGESAITKALGDTLRTVKDLHG